MKVVRTVVNLQSNVSNESMFLEGFLYIPHVVKDEITGPRGGGFCADVDVHVLVVGMGCPGGGLE